MTMTNRAIEELQRAGFFDKDSDYEGMIGESLEELLFTFQKQGHSGYSANLTAHLFYKLIKGEVLSPLTEDLTEWTEVSPNIFQSRRCSYVFIDKTNSNKPYTIEGKVFSDDGGQTYFTNINSRVYFDLPGYPPQKEYIILEK